MDIRARGVERELGWLCDITEFCPAHLARRYLKELKDHFVTKKGMTWHKLPLFPKADGSAMTKTEVVNMLRFLVKSYGADWKMKRVEAASLATHLGSQVLDCFQVGVLIQSPLAYMAAGVLLQSCPTLRNPH